MAVTYEAVFEYDESEKALSLTRVMPGDGPDTSPVDLAAVCGIEEACRDARWHLSPHQTKEIGKQLFDLLNGDRQALARALDEAHKQGEPL
ncbi:MAG: hypothetical protein JSV33_10520, partial [bacterium]